jgi:endonuclease/exonuclease/phosphatase (EEP) superfamily protein YafD
VGTFLLVVAALLFTGVALLRLLEIDGDRAAVVAFALMPYLTVLGVVLSLLALRGRRWAVAIVVSVLSIVLVAAVAPRAFPDSRPIGVGTTVRVLALNTRLGEADAASVVAAVRGGGVDVLALQELTPRAVSALDAAGLDAELRFRAFRPDAGPRGSGIASRFPLSELSLTPPSTFTQVAAEVTLPSGDLVQVVSVHVDPPVHAAGPEQWQRELAGLPDTEPRTPPRVLAGDFNGTLDHAAVRRVLAGGGYADAADEVGEGLVNTWPADRRLPPLVALDHVLVDRRCPVDAFRAIDVPGTDHRAVLAQFVVPSR